jgi:DNA-binding NarL/FixJ family response regulator
MEIGSKVRVLLVDDQPNVRRTLGRILEPYPNIQVVGEASDGDEAVASVGTLQPAVVVMDIKMNKMDGITAARLIKTQYPDVLVLGFSAELKDYEVNAMQQAGAFEVLRIEDTMKNLYPAIQRALAAIKSYPPDTKT